MAKSVFDIPVADMPHVAAGQPIRAKDFNTISDAVERIQKGVKPPQQVFPDRIAEAVGGGIGTRFRLATIDYDYLTAVKYNADGSLDTVATIIAKPWRLQRRTHLGTVQGVIYTWQSQTQRTLTQSGNSEIQVVTEPWRVTEDIIAIELENGVGFSVNNEPVTWYDLNAGAHAWAKKFGT